MICDINPCLFEKAFVELFLTTNFEKLIKMIYALMILFKKKNNNKIK